MEHVLYLDWCFFLFVLNRAIDIIIKMTLSHLLNQSLTASLLPFHGPSVTLHAQTHIHFVKVPSFSLVALTLPRPSWQLVLQHSSWVL